MRTFFVTSYETDTHIVIITNELNLVKLILRRREA